MKNIEVQKVAKVWNAKIGEPKTHDRFWFFPQITGHANAKICGRALPGTASGLHDRLSALAGKQSLPRGISIGCGRATKELNLLSRGIVQHFDLFDLADQRLAEAKQMFVDKGFSDRATFSPTNPLLRKSKRKYDLVYWNSSLHHMSDVHAAIAWSSAALKPGGIFAMYEFVGPTRFQWSDRNLHYVRRFREALPSHLYKKRAKDPWIQRPTIDQMIVRDPSEAADSSNIVPAVQKNFPDAQVTYIGGAIYHFGLNGIYGNIGPNDQWIFEQALILDDLLLEAGESHFAVCVGRKL
jgi:SAM-dependent methyltransferase